MQLPGGLNSLSPGLVVTLACAVLLLALWAVRGLGRRSTAVVRNPKVWAKTVRFSNNQLTAMRSLWHWYRTDKPPQADPLQHLTPSELADLISKCSEEFLPGEFRTPASAAERRALVERLERQGMESLHAEIVAGMKYGRLGPANDL